MSSTCLARQSFRMERPFAHRLAPMVSAFVLGFIWAGTTAGALAAPPVHETVIEQHSTVTTDRPHIGLALGGGGTRGAAHVGVLRVLQREGVPIDLIAGTSMGAVVGGLYAGGVPVDSIGEKFAKKSLLRAFLTVPIPVRIAAVPLFYVPRLLGFKSYDGFYRGGRFRDYLNRSVPESHRDIEKLQIPFGAVALNLIDGQAYTIRTGNLGRALQASAAVPILRKPVLLDGKMFVDGGVTANLPVSQAREMGADIVIAVDVDERFQPVPDKTFKEIGSVAHRVMTLHLAKVDEDQLRDADVVIHPNVNGIGLVSMRESDVIDAIKAGERAATEAMPSIRSRLQSSGIVLSPTTEPVVR